MRALKKSARKLAARQGETSKKSPRHQIAGCVRRKVRIRGCGCARSGVSMSKHESCSPLNFGTGSGIPPRERRGGSGLAARRAVLGEIGLVGRGHMGMAMAANLAAGGRRVIAYVRPP